MSRKKLKWPVAKVREDGTPAIWLTHSHWLLLRSGIIGAYLNARESAGRQQARREAKQPDEILDCYLGDFITRSNVEAALEIFTVGWNAWHQVAERNGVSTDWTPEDLVKAGNSRQERERVEYLKYLAAEAAAKRAA